MCHGETAGENKTIDKVKRPCSGKEGSFGCAMDLREIFNIIKDWSCPTQHAQSMASFWFYKRRSLAVDSSICSLCHIKQEDNIFLWPAAEQEKLWSLGLIKIYKS